MIEINEIECALISGGAESSGEKIVDCGPIDIPDGSTGPYDPN